MTNWVVVLIGFGIVAFALVLYRYAETFASAQRSQAKAMRYPEKMYNQFTPGLTRIGAIGFAFMGVLWILIGGFLGDKL